MTLQFIQNAGEEGAKQEDIYEYLKAAMPGNKSKEQHLRLLGHILNEMQQENSVRPNGRLWIATE